MSFTIEQFKNYLLNCDSLGDALYFLSEKSVLKANQEEEIEEGACLSDDPDDYPDGMYIANF